MIQLNDLSKELTEVMDSDLGLVVGGGGLAPIGGSTSLNSYFSSNQLPKVVMIQSPATVSTSTSTPISSITTGFQRDNVSGTTGFNAGYTNGYSSFTGNANIGSNGAVASYGGSFSFKW